MNLRVNQVTYNLKPFANLFLVNEIFNEIAYYIYIYTHTHIHTLLNLLKIGEKPLLVPTFLGDFHFSP